MDVGAVRVGQQAANSGKSTCRISARYLTLGDAKRQVDFCMAAKNA